MYSNVCLELVYLSNMCFYSICEKLLSLCKLIQHFIYFPCFQTSSPASYNSLHALTEDVETHSIM